jgi:magnesium chelatase family protein
VYAKVSTASLYGLESREVHVEVDVGNGLPSFSVVGLANRSIREAKERIHAAIDHCGYRFPQKRITVNLSPANRKKEGSHFDLPIAVGLLMSTGQIVPAEETLAETALIGELTLDGRLEPVEGVLPLVIGMHKRGIRHVILPMGNCREAESVKGMLLYPAETLLHAGEHITGFRKILPVAASGRHPNPDQTVGPDFCDIRGQELVKRAAVVAAAGGHGMLMVGPPGVGKTMVGRRIPGIMPALTDREQLDITQIYSIAGLLDSAMPVVARRPFRAPHHSLSAAAMTGGGSRPRPGEISLAHHGVLFLDELPEFSRQTLDTLRQPMEEGCVTISRVQDTLTFPANFVLVAAMNPCRCGYYGDPVRPCTCTETDRQKYAGKISGPLLDRIDLHIGMERMAYSDIDAENERRNGKSSWELRNEVEEANARQKKRYRALSIEFNAQLPPDKIGLYCHLSDPCRKLVRDAFSRWSLSARAYHRLLRVARTVADLSGSTSIKEDHILEALSYRVPDKSRKGGI